MTFESVGSDPRPHVLVVCTGNAARSVMAGAFLEAHGVAVRITTAGTHAIEHQPMSRRTRDALGSMGVEAPSHRSRQVVDSDLASADLVIAMERDHVRYIRKRHPEAAGRTATIRWLVENLQTGPGPLRERIEALDLPDIDPEDQPEVADPAGGDDSDYTRCALELRELVNELAERLTGCAPD